MKHPAVTVIAHVNMWWPLAGGDRVGSGGALRLLLDWVAKNGRQHTGMIPVSVAQPVQVYRYGGSAGMRTLTSSLRTGHGQVFFIICVAASVTLRSYFNFTDTW